MHALSRKHPLSATLSALAIATMTFALAPLDSASAAYRFKELYPFCSFSGCLDGGAPTGRLVLGRDGTLYGTAQFGGKYNNGVVFDLIPKLGRYREHVFHNFRGPPDGGQPVAGVILDISGNAYGTTYTGGANGAGTIFKLTHGSKGWTFGVLKNFCDQGGANCTDGGEAVAGLSYAGQDAGAAWDG